jgi:hypothetical protein
MKNHIKTEDSLILSAEDCPEELFGKLHRFSNYEERIIMRLIAHCSVLIRGERGSGKSALLIEAHRRASSSVVPTAFSVYSSLKHLPLMRGKEKGYKRTVCELLIDNIREELSKENISPGSFFPSPEPGSVQQSLVHLSSKMKKRIVLFFDDAVPIDRENTIAEFFDMFRTFSGASVSCKAAAYPGLTEFGARFNVYRHATVVDISRNETSRFFTPLFLEVAEARYPRLLDSQKISLTKEEIAKFLGRAVIGNMRAFVFLCNQLKEEQTISLNELRNSMRYLASDYYRPLLAETASTLENYEPLLDAARKLGERFFQTAEKAETTAVVVHQEWVRKFIKPIEILEDAGFLSCREASRAMESGGRGPLFVLNLCNLLECMGNEPLTQAKVDAWLNKTPPAEIDIDSDIFSDIKIPELPDNEREKLSSLKEKLMHIIKESPDEKLLSLPGIDKQFLKQIRDVLGQAI